MKEFYKKAIQAPEISVEPMHNRHYITTDAQGRIIDGWSDGPHRERDTADVICINGQGGYQFRLFPGGEENPPLHTMDGIPLYRWDGEKAVLRAEAEIEADRRALPGPVPALTWDTLASAIREGVDSI